MDVHMEAQVAPAGVERVGQDRITNAQRRKQDLAERAYIDDALRVERMQRRDRRAIIAELAVIIILDDVQVLLAGNANR